MSETMIKSRRVSKRCIAATAKLKDTIFPLKQSTKTTIKTQSNKLYQQGSSVSPGKLSGTQTCKNKKRSKTPIIRKSSSKKQLQLTKERSNLRKHMNKRSSSSTRLRSSIREFEMLGTSHRSLARNVSNAIAHTEVYVPDFQPEQYGNQLLTTFERTKKLLKCYSEKYNGLLKINQRLHRELKILHRERRKTNVSGIKL